MRGRGRRADAGGKGRASWVHILVLQVRRKKTSAPADIVERLRPCKMNARACSLRGVCTHKMQYLLAWGYINFRQ